MSYTELVHWHADVQGDAGRTAPRRADHVPALAAVRPHAPSEALEQPGDWGATPSYGGLVGWYADMVTAMARQETTWATTPVARPPLPHAA